MNGCMAVYVLRAHATHASLWAGSNHWAIIRKLYPALRCGNAVAVTGTRVTAP